MSLKTLFDEFNQSVSEIRDVINDNLAFHTHLAKTEEWSQICSALDTLDDTALAMDAYWSVQFDPDAQNNGSAYLFIYGLLQAMCLQQNAIMSLAKCFDLTIKVANEYPFMAQVREHRDWAVGHPVTNSHGPHTLSRPNLHRDSFELVSNNSKVTLRQRIGTESICSGQFREGKQALQRIKTAVAQKREGWSVS